MTELRDAALGWAERGIPVFPCRPRDKRPHGGQAPHGVLDATADPSTISAIWTEAPRSNIGGAMGDWLWCLDIDGEGGEASLAELEAKNGKLPETMTVRTGGGGRHMFFRLPSGVDIRNSSSKVGPDIDVRGTGGYVVLPPSVHPSGRLYTLANDLEPVDAPAWLLDLVVKPPKPDAAQSSPGLPLPGSTDADGARWAGLVVNATKRVREAPEGRRNETLNRVVFSVGGLVDAFGGDPDATIGALEDAASAAGLEPHEVREVRRMFGEGRAKPQPKPPDRPPEHAVGLDEWVTAGAPAAPAEPEPESPIVVQHGPANWVLEGKRYIPVQTSALATEIERIHEISCWGVKANGEPRRMLLPEIYERHGVTALELVWSVSADQPTWDGTQRELTVPAGRYRWGRVQQSARVARLLELACGPRLPIVLDWLAGLPRLDVPCAALALIGPPRCGKSMLGSAVSAVFGGHVAYDDAMTRFNAGLRHSPFVWLDERASADGDPNVFRRLTGNYEHRIEAKYQAIQRLLGCIRVLATSNHPDPFRLSDDHLGPLDDQAIGERIIIVDVQAEARDYLESLGGAEGTAGWCEPDGELVAHLRWIAQTRQVQRGSRFWVDGDGDDYVSKIGTQTGMPGIVLDAVSRYLDMSPEDRRKHIGDKAPCVFDRKYPDAVIVSAAKLLSCWPVLVGGSASPEASRVRGALQRLSRGPEKRLELANGERLRGYKIPRSTFGSRVDGIWHASTSHV